MPSHRTLQRHLAVAFSYGRYVAAGMGSCWRHPAAAALRLQHAPAAAAWRCLRLVAAALCCCTTPGHAAELIALDTGHNLANPGATSARGVAEFDFNRALVLALDSQLRQAGYRTELIGIDGQTTDLASRPRRARDAGASLFISVHHDSARERYLRDWEYEGKPRKYLDARFQGFSLFVSRQNPQWRAALECASALGANLRAAGFRPSRYHADPVFGEAREFADETNGVHFFDNLGVLRNAVVPALLYEAGVIVNREEEVRLGSEAARTQIAQALIQAMPACLATAAGARGAVLPARASRASATALPIATAPLPARRALAPAAATQ
jgi:N-acetylmuramoyl-L-alanine amidase